MLNNETGHVFEYNLKLKVEVHLVFITMHGLI